MKGNNWSVPRKSVTDLNYRKISSRCDERTGPRWGLSGCRRRDDPRLFCFESLLLLWPPGLSLIACSASFSCSASLPHSTHEPQIKCFPVEMPSAQLSPPDFLLLWCVLSSQASVGKEAHTIARAHLGGDEGLTRSVIVWMERRKWIQEMFSRANQ